MKTHGMNAKAPLKLAFVGGGIGSAVGYTHFCASRLDSEFELMAGCFSRDPEVNKETATRYGVETHRCYVDWRALLAGEQGSIDALAVLTPIPSHLEIVLAALEAGIPVISEKALAISSAECDQIDTAVTSAQTYLAVTYNYSGYPMVRELRDLIQRGELGEIRHLAIEMPQEGYLRKGASPQDWRLQDYSVPTVSLDLGAHVYHLANFLTGGAEILSVTGTESCHGQFSQLVDTVSCIARLESGAELNAWWSKAALGYSNGLRIRVFGREGSAEWFQAEPEYLKLATGDGSMRRIDRGCEAIRVANQERYTRFKAGHPAGFVEAFANLYLDIAEEIRAGAAAPSAERGYVFGAPHSGNCLRFLEAVSRGARSESWQAL